MGFESVRGYVQLASGLGELTRARATEAAQGLLSLPGVGIATGKVAGQVGALAEELLAAATTNREHLTAMVRSEVNAAVTRLGLVPAEQLEESRAEAARLRAEVAQLRSSSTSTSSSATSSSLAEGARSSRRAGRPSRASIGAASKKAVARRSTPPPAASVKPTTTAKAAKTAKTAAAATTTRRSAVTTRRKPTGT